MMLGIVGAELTAMAGGEGAADGVVLTGGCALNVKLNDRLRSRFGLRVSAPSAPTDGGLAMGGLLIVSASATHTGPVHTGYWGTLPWDIDSLDAIAKLVDAAAATAVGVADGMVDGAAIAGVMRGRSEFRHRALGHRSLLWAMTI